MTQTYQDFLNALGFRESSSIPNGVQNYDVENPFGFIGKYQFGEAALYDLGYYGTDNSDSNLFKNDWVGNWSGKNGIHSKQDYLDNGFVQEIIIREWQGVLWNRIQFLALDKYEGQILNGQPITLSGMLATAHLIGAGSRSSDTAGLKGYLLSGATFSRGDGNGTSANDYMALFEGFQIPFNVDHSTDELIAGGSGNDILQGFGGNDTLIGNEAIDTAIYTGPSANYTVERQSDNLWTVHARNGSPDGTDTLIDIERIRFSDTSLALDLDGNAGITAKIIGAVFGADSVADTQLAGIGLNLLDDGTDYEALMQLAIHAALGDEAESHATVVDLLYENVAGSPPPAADKTYFVDLLDSGAHSVASIGIFAAETAINLENINFPGLSQSGLELGLWSA
jgi:RTX calcium-binding nonapeptide repeat (4 copies)